MMSSKGAFVMRHTSGLYLQSHTVWPGFKPYERRPAAIITYSLVPGPISTEAVWSQENWERRFEADGWPDVADQWTMEPKPICACCGETYRTYLLYRGETIRCKKHEDRNPCVIQGCTRTQAARGSFTDAGFLCSEHWRRYVPPGSPGRKAYHRLHRIGKRRGWPDDLRVRYWRFWGGLVKRAIRDSQQGRLDMTAVNALFGWSDDE